jgi:tetratricopeptide (TPR) repeat protein
MFRFFRFALPALIACACLAAAQTAVDSLLEQARIQEKSGNYSAAEQTYRQALDSAPDNMEVLKRLGVLQQTEFKFDESIETFQRVLAKHPKYPQVNFFEGVSLYGKNDVAKAIDCLRRELATPDPHPKTRSYLSTLLEVSGRGTEAIEQLNQSLAENPKDANALYELARLHKNASFQAMERLKAIDPDSFQVHLLLGELYADEQRYPEAIKEYQAAKVKRPEAQGVHFPIGVAYWAQKEFVPADKEFRDALRENPTDAITNLYIGDIAVRDGRFEEALRFLNAAKASQPNMPQIHVLLGKCYQRRNDLVRAKAELLEAIQGDPTAARPHYLLSQVYRKLNDQTESATELAKFQLLSKSAAEKTPTPGMGSEE